QQDLVQTRETLAAREAELEELKSRLAELEQLQQQQAQLIEMKDSELAAAQQRLAEHNAAGADGGGLPWLWIGLALVAAALLAAWLLARRPSRPSGRGSVPGFASAAGRGPPAATGASPTWHAGGDVRVEPRSGAELPPLDAGPAGRDRIELARAYLDLGDTDTARSLLQEVADFGDPGPRDEALQLLRELA